MKKISLVIPCFKVKNQILDVIKNIPSEIFHKIYIVNDNCPENSWKVIEENLDILSKDKIKFLHNEINLGVGGATKKGFYEAIKDNQDIIVKMDGDGQMDPIYLNKLLKTIDNGENDYAKGNRFYNFEGMRGMPKLRLFGNAVLSFIAKLSHGYWNIYDPNNGYIAMSVKVLKQIPIEKLSNSYFFESDLLFRMNILGAKVIDVPMNSVYRNEKSNLVIKKIFFEFLKKHFINFCKRIFYNYYLRNFTIASIELPIGIFMFFYGLITGYSNLKYYESIGTATPEGIMVMKIVLVIIGAQLLLNFINYDMNSYPKTAINKNL